MPEVDSSSNSPKLFHRRLEGGLAIHLGDVEKLVPEGLALGLFGGGAFPIAGEADGAVADFVPVKHGWKEARETGGAGARGFFGTGESAGASQRSFGGSSGRLSPFSRTLGSLPGNALLPSREWWRSFV